MFSRVNRVGRTWEDGITVKAVWHIVNESARALEWRSWRRTIYDEPVLGSATHREASWSKSNFFWDTYLFKRPNATWAATSGFDQRLFAGRNNCTGQQLIDIGTALITEKRVAVDLQIAEGGLAGEGTRPLQLAVKVHTGPLPNGNFKLERITFQNWRRAGHSTSAGAMLQVS